MSSQDFSNEIVVTLAVARETQNQPFPPEDHRHLRAQIGLVVILSLIGLSWYVLGSLNRAQLTLDFGGQQRVFQGKVTNGMTVLDALNAAVIAGGIPLEFKIIQDQTQITRLDDHGNIAQDSKLYFVLNETPVNATQIHRIQIKPHDQIMVQLP